MSLSHLTSIKQGCDEFVNDFVQRFRETKNQCFSLTISEKDLAGLAFSGLRSHLRDKLEGHDFTNLTQLQQRASTQESRSQKSHTDHLVIMCMLCNVMLIVLTMSPLKCLLLNSFGHLRPNLLPVNHSSRFIRICRMR